MDEPKKPDAAQTERAEPEKAKSRPTAEPAEGGKPDEGLRPDQLTSESDGGSQG